LITNIKYSLSKHLIFSASVRHDFSQRTITNIYYIYLPKRSTKFRMITSSNHFRSLTTPHPNSIVQMPLLLYLIVKDQKFARQYDS
jgi:hypothetical protein